MTDRLNVTMDFGAGSVRRTLGQLGRDPRNRSFAFEWDPAFTSDPLPIWPIRLKTLAEILRPQRQRRRSVPGLFEDSLPDGWGKLLLDREIRASGGESTMLDDMKRLAFVGGHGMGALCYAPSTTPQPKDRIDLEWFENVVPRVEGGSSIEELQTLRAISGGGQGNRPKFVAQIDASHKTLRDHRNDLEPGREAFGEVARIGGIKPRRRDTIIDEVDTALAQWSDVAKEFDVPKTKQEKINATIQRHISSDFNKAQSRL